MEGPRRREAGPERRAAARWEGALQLGPTAVANSGPSEPRTAAAREVAGLCRIAEGRHWERVVGAGQRKRREAR